MMVLENKKASDLKSKDARLSDISRQTEVIQLFYVA